MRNERGKKDCYILSDSSNSYSLPRGPFSGKLDQELFVVEEDLSDVVPTTKAETVDSLKQSSSDLPVDTQKAALDSSVTAVTDLPPKFDGEIN